MFNVIRYVERNALRAHLVNRSEGWRWCSLREKLYGDRGSLRIAWRRDRPKNRLAWVNEAQRAAEVEAKGRCVNRGTSYGSGNWNNSDGGCTQTEIHTSAPRSSEKKGGGIRRYANVKRFASPFLSPWVCGLGQANRKNVETLMQYSHEQGMIGRKMTLQELFIDTEATAT